MIKLIFFGTPYYVVSILDKLHKKFKYQGESPISAVVTQEPKPVGRENIKTYSPVDTWAYQHKRPIFFDPADVLKENIKADIGILASYGKIIPKEVINFFKYGIINIHPSLLPLWRGASPIPASIFSGETETGVTFMKLDEFLDHGPIISRFKDNISETDNSEVLKNRLFERAGDVLVNLIPAYINNKCNITPQDESKATFTKHLTKENGFIPPQYLKSALEAKNVKAKWEIIWMYNKTQNKDFKTPFTIKPSASDISNFIRAMYPWPGAWTHINLNSKFKNEKLKISKQNPLKHDQNIKRIKILKTHLGDSKLILDEVQLEGKSPVSWKQFIEGYPEAKFTK